VLLRQRGRLFLRAVIERGRLTLRNIWGTRSLGARTSGPHEALPYLEEMRTGGPSVPRRAGRYSISTGAKAQEESPILTACHTPNQSKNLTSTPLRYRGKENQSSLFLVTIVVPSRYLIDILPLILHRHLVMVLFHDHFDEATTFSGSQNTDSSMSFNLRQLAQLGLSAHFGVRCEYRGMCVLVALVDGSGS